MKFSKLKFTKGKIPCKTFSVSKFIFLGILKRAGVPSGTSAASLAFEYLQNGAIAEAVDIGE